jgi:hypothetical protein
MATDPQFRVQDDRFETGANAPEAPKKKSALATCLTGCLIAFVVILVLAIIAGVWAYRKFPEWAAMGISEGAKQVINETDLPEEEKADISIQIDRLAEATRERKLSLAQMGEFLQNLMQSPLMTTLAMSVIDKKYITPSGLSDEEKAEAQVTVQRFMRGAIDQKISDAEMKKALAPVSTEKPDGEVELKETVTDDELKAFLTAAKEQADAAGIPEEVEAVDPSDEFQRLVDKTLGDGAAEVPAAEDAPAEEAASAEVEEPATN